MKRTNRTSICLFLVAILLAGMGACGLCAGTDQLDGFTMKVAACDQTGGNQPTARHQFIYVVAHMCERKRTALTQRVRIHHRMQKICHISICLSSGVGEDSSAKTGKNFCFSQKKNSLLIKNRV